MTDDFLTDVANAAGVNAKQALGVRRRRDRAGAAGPGRRARPQGLKVDSTPSFTVKQGNGARRWSPSASTTSEQAREGRVVMLRVAAIAVAVIGLGIAAYLTIVHYAGGAPVCAITHGCATVQKSDYCVAGRGAGRAAGRGRLPRDPGRTGRATTRTSPHRRGVHRRLPSVSVNALARLGAQKIELIGNGLKHTQSSVRRAVVDALGRMKHPVASEMLSGALGDEEASVRLAAVNALAHIGNRSVERKLLALMRTDPDTAVRRAAQKALSR